MTAVYQDQIWPGSQCRKFEHEAIKLIRDRGGEPVLVDAVVSSYPYRRLVTDNVTTLPHVALYPEYWGTYSYEPRYHARAPSKVFNCFMNRVCTTRQSWFYQLVRRGLLDQGLVSFRLDSRQPPYGIELYEHNYHGYEIFQVEHQAMRGRVPYCNFRGDLEQVVIDSHVSLVIETYFDWPDTVAFSEKIFRALQLPRPFMLFGAPGAVGVLRRHGFDVWDDIVDSDYDSEPDPIQRQIMLLDQLDAWRDRRFSQLDLDRFEHRAAHNRSLLESLRARWPARLKTALESLPA